MNKQVIKTSFCKDTNFSRQELRTHLYVTGIFLPAASARLFAHTTMETRRNKESDWLERRLIRKNIIIYFIFSLHLY
jgi:hypothetical protein